MRHTIAIRVTELKGRDRIDSSFSQFSYRRPGLNMGFKLQHRRTDGVHALADQQVGAGPDAHRPHLLLRVLVLLLAEVDLQHRDVLVFVEPHHLGLVTRFLFVFSATFIEPQGTHMVSINHPPPPFQADIP